jgi:ABC-type glutathione transport system ATPase component
MPGLPGWRHATDRATVSPWGRCAASRAPTPKWRTRSVLIVRGATRFGRQLSGPEAVERFGRAGARELEEELLGGSVLRVGEFDSQLIERDRDDGQAAIAELNLEIADGELAVLVGPSGSGKSTALRMIAGLEEISAGVVWIGDGAALVGAGAKPAVRSAPAA